MESLDEKVDEVETGNATIEKSKTQKISNFFVATARLLRRETVLILKPVLDPEPVNLRELLTPWMGEPLPLGTTLGPYYHLYGESAEGIRLPFDRVAANELADGVLENYFEDLKAGSA